MSRTSELSYIVLRLADAPASEFTVRELHTLMGLIDWSDNRGTGQLSGSLTEQAIDNLEHLKDIARRLNLIG